MSDTHHIHIYRDNPNKQFYILLLLIPSMVFALMLALYMSTATKKQAAATTNTSILGTQTQSVK